MEFWTRQADHEEWRSIPAAGATLTAGTYAILTRSPQPHFTISVDVYRYDPQSENKVLHQQRFTRTDEEGLGEILPWTLLEPGRWEFHCRDGDLIAELFGENQADVLCLEIHPSDSPSQPRPDWSHSGDGQRQHYAGIPVELESSPRERSDLGRELEPKPIAHPQEDRIAAEPLHPPAAASPEPEPEPETDSPTPEPISGTSNPDPNSAPADKLFSLMHSRLQGAPGEVLVLTGRIGCSGDLEARVYNQKQLVFENQRTIRLPNDARSAVFSIQVPLPASPWSSHLIGTLTLRGLTDGSHSSLTFTVSCLEQKNGAGSSAPLRSPLLSKAPQEIPINQYRDPLLPSGSEDVGAAPLAQRDTAVSRPSFPLPLALGEELDGSAENALFAARTLRKMLRICHDGSELSSDGLDPTPTVGIEDPDEPASAAPALSLTPQASDSTPAGDRDEGDSGEELWPQADPHAQLSFDPDPDLDRLDSEPSDPAWSAPPPQEAHTLDPLDLMEEEAEAEEPEPTPFRWSVVSTLPREKTEISRDRGATAASRERFKPQGAPQELPMPEIWVPESLQGGETVDVVLRLHPPEDGISLWIKLWLKQDRTRSILDGPRWLLDFTRTDQGYLQAITRMTIPHGSGEVLFEAWAVTSDLVHHGERTLLRRSVQQ